MFGILSDKTKSKYGKRKLWMTIFLVPYLLFFFFLWYVPPFTQTYKIVYYQFATILFSAAFTGFSLPYFSLAPEITHSYDERTTLVGYRTGAGILGKNK